MVSKAEGQANRSPAAQIILLVFILTPSVRAVFHPSSICPEIFNYEGNEPEYDRWYGEIRLASNDDLVGVVLNIKFDRVTQLLVSWTGEVKSDNNIDYSIINLSQRLRPRDPIHSRFMVKFNNTSGSPRIRAIRLNGRQICPPEMKIVNELHKVPSETTDKNTHRVVTKRPDPVFPNVYTTSYYHEFITPSTHKSRPKTTESYYSPEEQTYSPIGHEKPYQPPPQGNKRPQQKPPDEGGYYPKPQNSNKNTGPSSANNPDSIDNGYSPPISHPNYNKPNYNNNNHNEEFYSSGSHTSSSSSSNTNYQGQNGEEFSAENQPANSYNKKPVNNYNNFGNPSYSNEKPKPAVNYNQNNENDRVDANPGRPASSGSSNVGNNKPNHSPTNSGSYAHVSTQTANSGGKKPNENSNIYDREPNYNSGKKPSNSNNNYDNENNYNSNAGKKPSGNNNYNNFNNYNPNTGYQPSIPDASSGNENHAFSNNKDNEREQEGGENFGNTNVQVSKSNKTVIITQIEESIYTLPDSNKPDKLSVNNNNKNKNTEDENAYAFNVDDNRGSSPNYNQNYNNQFGANSKPTGSSKPTSSSSNKPNTGSSQNKKPQTSSSGISKVPPNANREDVCGQVTSEAKSPATPLVTHGQATARGQWPWHVALYETDSINLSYICGGSLITSNLVLTAAHCVTKKPFDRPVDPRTIVIYLGKYHLQQYSDDAGIQIKQVVEIIPFSTYNSSNYLGDIAILKLTSNAEYTAYVRPVCLWDSRSTDLSAVIDDEGIVIGWGYDEYDKASQELKMARMPVVSQETCLFSNRVFFSQFTSNKTYCAGFRNGTSVCNGDSGGGMVFSRGNTWYLRGLVSISVAQSGLRKCDTNHYVVFTDVAKYLDWIKAYIQKISRTN